MATLVLTAAHVELYRRQLADVDKIHRNFFGVLRVKMQPDEAKDGQWVCRLLHGRTMHGLQFTDEHKSKLATTYYGEDSGIGLVLRNHRANQPRRIGVVGLGVGTLAVYAGSQDRLRFYEINPDVVELADGYFTYLELCQCQPEIILGDARLSLENESTQAFDVLVLDAFSSDAIPIHLLTREALAIYLRHLTQDGILAVHISNMHLDLRPVLAGHAEHFGLQMAVVDSHGDDALGTCSPKWALLSKRTASLRIPEIENSKSSPVGRKLHWTDQRSSLLQVLKTE
jgi:spermidine synthase